MTALDELEALLKQKSVRFGDFVLASGQRSRYYIDCRLTTMSAQGLVLIGRLALAAIQERGWRPSAVGGLTLGADPVSYAVAQASAGTPSPIDAFSVRKEPKQHGTARRIEGNFEPGRPVVVIEDVITSGGSALEAIQAIQTAGGTVLGVLAVVDREQGGKQNIEEAGFQVVALTTTTRLGIG